MRALLAVAVLAGLIASPAAAHRIDEYVEGTLVGVAADRVVLDLQLTPGQEVAPAVLALVDPDRDGVISDNEGAAYAETVMGDLWLAIDGEQRELRLVAWSFPPAAAMREGIGYMTLRLEADIPSGADTTHSLAFQNRHQPEIGVYMVNALAPSDPGVAILSQERNADQSLYQMDFTISPGP